MKFNANESTKSCLNLARIGGIMRNEAKELKISFSKLIGTINSSKAKIMVVKEALLIYSASRWKDNHHLIIKIDASNIVNWVKNRALVP